MGKQFYVQRDFKLDTLALVDTMNTIIDDYVQQGFRLTVRQLYYQLVAQALIENTEKSYKRITGIVNDAKLAGLMDWEAIEDRTREFLSITRWESGAEIVRNSARAFHMDMWSNQPHRLFVIVEKEALAGVLQGVCEEFDMPLLAARGYPSGTVLREFCVRDVLPYCEAQAIRILHLGDHDPSGIDMTRDLKDRVQIFSETTGDVGLTRIALNMPQIQSQKPPPNPAKTTDARFASYRTLYGSQSWELDALKPQYLAGLIRAEARRYIDKAAWKERSEEVEAIRERLQEVATEFEERA